MFVTQAIRSGDTQKGAASDSNYHLRKRISDEKDVIHFKTRSHAHKNIIAYIDLLCDKIHGTRDKVFNHKYRIQNEVLKKCFDFLVQLKKLCDDTDLKKSENSSTLRFGHIAFRDWHDQMALMTQHFIYNDLAKDSDIELKNELCTYLIESFGNKMRIDYGTGHELNFIIFTMGLANLLTDTAALKDNNANQLVEPSLPVTPEHLSSFVERHGWDVHYLFATMYLHLCRAIQTKFRLEPAGSRGVYNMDDFQFLPFLFGAAQLVGTRHIPVSEFYQFEQVDMFKRDYIFFQAVDFTLNNKRGPFNEHSYTLWCYTGLGSWETIYRRIRTKFTEDILGPFPIVQHLLFGKYILRWE